MVNRTLLFLDTLEIPRESHPGGRGFCSFCWLFHPCRYVATEEGVCNRRPVIQQVIAVLSSQHDHRLGHVAAELAGYQTDEGLSTEQGTRSWLERRMPFKMDSRDEGYWLPNLLLVFETLVISFFSQQTTARGVHALLGFPGQSSRTNQAAPKENRGSLTAHEGLERIRRLGRSHCVVGY